MLKSKVAEFTEIELKVDALAVKVRVLPHVPANSGFDVYGKPQYGFHAAKVSTPVSGTPT